MIVRITVYTIIASMLITSTSNAQSYFTVQIGNVVYSSSSVDADSAIKENYAELCNKYIERYYHGEHLPLVYLIIRCAKIDTSCYQLAYDNLSGYPSNHKYYGSDKRFNQPGIRIKIYSNRGEWENLLKLLDYGINNIKELKQQRKSLIKQNRDDGLESISLSQDKITSILKEPVSSEIGAILNKG